MRWSFARERVRQPILLLPNFDGQIIPFKLEKLKQIIGGKKIQLKVYTKLVARGCNHHPTTRGTF